MWKGIKESSTMINSQNFVFSKAAAARILGVPLWAIAGFEKWWKVCWVWVKGRRPVFISLKAFKQHFVEWRKEQSQSLCVAKVTDSHYRVVNPKKNSVYSVWLFQDGLDCECEDFRNQVLILKKACCKHCYAVLTWLRFDSLTEYIEHHRWAA
jgi:hypothetical protein